MEILFKNKFVRSKQMLKEIYAYYFFKRPLIIVCDILIAFCLLNELIFTFLLESFVPNPYIFLVAIVLPVLEFLLYRINVNAQTKRDLETFKNPPTIEIAFTNDCITYNVADTSNTTLDYSSIKLAVVTKSCIGLITKANLLYMVKKDSFTVGNLDDFLTFIKSKGIKVKNK